MVVQDATLFLSSFCQLAPQAVSHETRHREIWLVVNFVEQW
jgi:hypothetical protein